MEFHFSPGAAKRLSGTECFAAADAEKVEPEALRGSAAAAQPMIAFGLPGQPLQTLARGLPKGVHGTPYT